MRYSVQSAACTVQLLGRRVQDGQKVKDRPRFGYKPDCGENPLGTRDAESERKARDWSVGHDSRLTEG